MKWPSCLCFLTITRFLRSQKAMLAAIWISLSHTDFTSAVLKKHFNGHCNSKDVETIFRMNVEASPQWWNTGSWSSSTCKFLLLQKKITKSFRRWKYRLCKKNYCLKFFLRLVDLKIFMFSFFEINTNIFLFSWNFSEDIDRCNILKF